MKSIIALLALALVAGIAVADEGTPVAIISMHQIKTGGSVRGADSAGAGYQMTGTATGAVAGAAAGIGIAAIRSAMADGDDVEVMVMPGTGFWGTVFSGAGLCPQNAVTVTKARIDRSLQAGKWAMLVKTEDGGYELKPLNDPGIARSHRCYESYKQAVKINHIPVDADMLYGQK